MNKRRVIIYGNGTLHADFVKEIRRGDYVIGVDRAAYWLISHTILPDIAIGDFDSTTQSEVSVIKKKVKKVKEYPSQKDQTDLELAIDHALSLHPEEVIIYGAIGSRFDHTLAGVNLLEKLLKKNITAKICDIHNEVVLVSSRHTIIKSKTFKYLSLLPYSAKAVVTLKGVKYPVTKRTFYRGESLGVSNEIIDRHADIEVHSGIALVIKSNDKRR